MTALHSATPSFLQHLRRMTIGLAAPLLLAATPQLASAQLVAEKAGLGAALLVRTDHYRGISNDTDLLPVLSYENDKFRLFHNEASYNVLQRDTFDVNLKGQYRLAGYDSADSDFLEGMGKRRGALEFGVEATSAQWFGNLSAEFMTDITSRHKGYEIKFEYGYPLQIAYGLLTPRLSLAFQSSRLTNYYWGVTRSEIRADRPEYNPGNSVNLAVGLRYENTFARQHTIFADAEFQRMGNAIEDSPIRSSSDPITLTVGYLFTF